MSVVTPSVFKTLDENNASKFLRFIFPRMFLYGFILSTAALILSIWAQDVVLTFGSLLIAILFLVNAYAITPLINKYRDQYNNGYLESDKVFKKYHLISVLIFLFQLVVLIYLVVRNIF
tara:strand:- start:24 stop:380 length:357 start_codon:yes stop_codon:yes gene_type:complete